MAGLSVASNILLVAAKLVVGFWIQSVSVISEAIHSGLDLVAAVIAYFSLKMASKPADETHKFGHGKIENVSATVEAILIVLAAAWIIAEASRKLILGAVVEFILPGVIVMSISAAVNFFVSSRLLKIARKEDSVALEADALHLRTDVYTSAGVVIGLIALHLTGLEWLDPAVAILVALIILKAAYNLLREAFLPLLDVKLPASEEAAIVGIIERHASQYVEFHKLRTRKAGRERHVDLHMVLPKKAPVHVAHTLCHHIADDIRDRFPHTHVMIHVEPCQNECKDCSDCRTLE